MIDSSMIEICTNPHDEMSGGEILGKLAGQESHDLVTRVKKSKKPIERYLNIISFFNSQDGDLEFTNMLGLMNGMAPQTTTTSTRVFYL
jgi:hypothetical protein